MVQQNPEVQTRLTLLRRRQVEARTGLRRSSLYSLIARGEFPAQVHLSERSVGWDERAVEHWIEARIKAGRKEA